MFCEIEILINNGAKWEQHVVSNTPTNHKLKQWYVFLITLMVIRR